jgi:DNA-binding NarL/FixJ family response regulator
MSASSAHVLVVDDSPLMRRMVREVLESESGFKIVGEAQNGREAIRRAKQLKPDLVILDLGMPVMNGLEAAPALKRTLPEVRLILLTMYSDPEVEQTARSAGIDAVVPKDEALEHLVQTARQLVGGRPAVM